MGCLKCFNNCPQKSKQISLLKLIIHSLISIFLNYFEFFTPFILFSDILYNGAIKNNWDHSILSFVNFIFNTCKPCFSDYI